jgi:hypothetical protein
VTSTTIFGLGTGLLAWCVLLGMIITWGRRITEPWRELGHITRDNTTAVRDLTTELSGVTNVLTDHEHRITALENRRHT